MSCNDISHRECEIRFNHHPPQDPFTIERHVVVRRALKDAAEILLETCVPCRETSLALTKLEEAMMWANAGIARAGAREAARVNGPGSAKGSAESDAVAP